MGDNPFKFFQKPTPAEIERREAETAVRNLQRYGRADYSNEKEETAWKLFDDIRALPIGEARKAAVDQWHLLMRDGRRLSNIEAARHRQQQGRAEYWNERMKAKAATIPRQKGAGQDQDQEPKM